LNEIVGQQRSEGKDNTEEMQLLRSIEQKKELIKANPFYGDNIEKKKIPKSYNVQNLWRVELTGYWRLLYTIKGDQVEIVCFVLEIVDHERYDRIFGYKGN
jgi:mRNA-degrading endonuclease RelE of RelBE toxin-antitoxin system